ncbi:endonuclease III [Tessaracoccus flavescens]|uniref:Endonuclease III n=1 Tax=Tessaracoccus flavescens TaxID=399497 RepID=A0A1Q2CW32_9ACTN|nr:endonuclease III [Tessaracoccus flavescens]AQP50284.1 endonuclease III [Tessaracoccus flavescens]
MNQPEAINQALATLYPDARAELDFTSPFELLIATVLSAQSTDRRVNAVTAVLFDRYPTPLALAEADRAQVEEIIQPVGFFRNKTTAIIGLSRSLVDDFDGNVPDTLDELVTLPGVGRKTANVVLGNAFDIPGITPDTHLIRLANRFGWVESTKPDVVEQAVGALFPPSEWVMVCHRVIWHGRRCCHARKPACGACVVYDLCPSRDLGEQDPVKAAKLIREPRN